MIEASITYDNEYIQAISQSIEFPAPRPKSPLLKLWQIIGIILGLLLICIPVATDRIAQYKAEQSISNYAEHTLLLQEEIDDRLANAEAYNKRLAALPYNYNGTIKPYDDQITSTGIFAWIEFPKLMQKIPIYHGIDKTTLQLGAGHVVGTSLPVGGTSTHAFLTAHSGMIGNRMFDDIRQLDYDDIFIINVLDRTLAYKVCDIQVVYPEDAENFAIERDRDLVTLITCTPYGINDHRLLVTGERTEYVDGMEEDFANTAAFFNMRTIPFIIAVSLIPLFLLLFLLIGRKNRKQQVEPLIPDISISEPIYEFPLGILCEFWEKRLIHADESNRFARGILRKH